MDNVEIKKEKKVKKKEVKPIEITAEMSPLKKFMLSRNAVAASHGNKIPYSDEDLAKA